MDQQLTLLQEELNLDAISLRQMIDDAPPSNLFSGSSEVTGLCWEHKQILLNTAIPQFPNSSVTKHFIIVTDGRAKTEVILNSEYQVYLLTKLLSDGFLTYMDVGEPKSVEYRCENRINIFTIHPERAYQTSYEHISKIFMALDSSFFRARKVREIGLVIGDKERAVNRARLRILNEIESLVPKDQRFFEHSVSTRENGTRKYFRLQPMIFENTYGYPILFAVRINEKSYSRKTGRDEIVQTSVTQFTSAELAVLVAGLTMPLYDTLDPRNIQTYFGKYLGDKVIDRIAGIHKKLGIRIFKTTKKGDRRHLVIRDNVLKSTF